MGIVGVARFIRLVFLCLLYLDRSDGRVIMKQLSPTKVDTRYGKVRGILVEFPNRHLRPVVAYLGLRYADLDNGNLRFMPPRSPTEKWKGIRVMMKHQPVCPQATRHEKDLSSSLPDGRVAHLRNITPYLTEQREDCLTLNLYVPTREWNDTSQVPVMVFIHGESYDTGTGNAYDGSVLSSYGDVIVVTLNYRLGVLGFLSTGDKVGMGNYALLDIIQALHWLRENIARFSGDPQNVTLVGHGHGASLVNLLLLSPLASDPRGPFFQRAIIQSGSGLSTWALSYDPVWCAQKLAINVNCSMHIADSHKLISCLRQKTPKELVDAAPLPPKYYSCFAPSIDGGPMLQKKVRDIIKERQMKFTTAKVMFGITKNEAYSYLKQQEIQKGISEYRKTQIIRTYVQNVFRYHRQKIFEILDHHYTDWNRISDKITKRNNILELLSDGQYVGPLVEAAKRHSETADTYLYAFSYSTQSENAQNVHGIHGDELPYVFGAPLVDGVSPFPNTYTNAEKMISEAVMTYWTNFAKTGNPNLPRNQSSVHGGPVRNRFVNIDWPKYENVDQSYLQIARRPIVRHHYRAQKLALWLDLIPKINLPDSSDPSQHLLKNSEDMSSFDDPHRLVPAYDNVFPSPPPMPPSSPRMKVPKDATASSTNYYPEVTLENGSHNPLYHEGIDNPEGVTPAAGVNLQHGNGNDVTAVPGSVGQPNSSNHPVPLSFTVAIGCSLLLINLLIFAGVCYQRSRIKKLRQHQEEQEEHEAEEVEPDELKLARKLEKETVRNATGTETMGLMSNPSNHHSPAKTPNCHSSPQSNRKPIIPAKPPQAPGAGYSYTAIPTQTTSPMHRTAMAQGHPIQMNTFGKGLSHDASLPRSENDGHIYKKINKPNSRDMSDSNNAITIV